ncbi:putative circadian clock protein, KaiC [Methanospirillum hungatei JF-1]|jgi:KaiC domain protein|uniref:Circadian clock protein, KaiC n=1 Tax=Methanospirillum hungatei JF-1 (strain ATCC 27890 / DSM 864 / NBRC 100397 / JF-1) TaxID=323259 RepID=Q2FNQ2_METHJ|nr:KaiC domain-containing protein [Methanospirillum hungatei]ABD40918.1 putative circadian clock protein, KaiC [Methanospirillum hungatei JF-1]
MRIPLMSIPRFGFGIKGLDEMLSGGLIEGTVSSIIGAYGTGKTNFAQYYIWQGLIQGQSALYITLEERTSRILGYMENKGWDVSQYLDSTFTIVNLDPSDFNLAINSVKNELPTLIKKTGAHRVVIDPVSLFEDLFHDDATRRREMMRFLESLRDLNCTSLLISEADKTNTFASKYNLIEYLSDTVILLKYARGEDVNDVHLAIEVVKMRMSQHSREVKPFEIHQDSVTVYTEATVF